MRLAAAHPEVANLSCTECENFLVEVPITGAFVLHRITREPIPRPKGSPTPCTSCPKCNGLPAKECNPKAGRLATLSFKNQQTLQLYWRVKGSSGAGLEMDEITRRNLGLIEHELYRQQLRRELK
jgi:hypothetical protein